VLEALATATGRVDDGLVAAPDVKGSDPLVAAVASTLQTNPARSAELARKVTSVFQSLLRVPWVLAQARPVSQAPLEPA
jgi:hypothetical protein